VGGERGGHILTVVERPVDRAPDGFGGQRASPDRRPEIEIAALDLGLEGLDVLDHRRAIDRPAGGIGLAPSPLARHWAHRYN
jgi:hypothetical protein